jgi:hypothetical protein
VMLAACESGSDGAEMTDMTREQGETPAAAGDAAGVDTGQRSVPPQRPETALTEVGGKTLLEVTPGTYEIEFSGTGVIILANQDYDIGILYELGERAGFDVIDEGAPWELVSVSIEATDMRDALGELLRLHAYELVYEFDGELRADRLKQVIVGVQPREPVRLQSGLTQDVNAATDDPSSSSARARDEDEDYDDDEEGMSADEQVYFSQLVDPSPGVRAEAAANIEATETTLDYLAEIMATDPSPLVRAAAVESLGDSDDPRAVKALITGLGDKDPAVLVEVIEALEYADDSRAIPRLKPLVDHPDENVRMAAESALENFDALDGRRPRPLDDSDIELE